MRLPFPPPYHSPEEEPRHHENVRPCRRLPTGFPKCGFYKAPSVILVRGGFVMYRFTANLHVSKVSTGMLRFEHIPRIRAGYANALSIFSLGTDTSLGGRV